MPILFLHVFVSLSPRLLVRIVQRARLCLDFASTIYFLHTLVVAAWDGTFPRSWSYWLLTIASAAVAVVLGEWLCMRADATTTPAFSFPSVSGSPATAAHSATSNNSGMHSLSPSTTNAPGAASSNSVHLNTSSGTGAGNGGGSGSGGWNTPVAGVASTATAATASLLRRPAPQSQSHAPSQPPSLAQSSTGAFGLLPTTAATAAAGASMGGTGLTGGSHIARSRGAAAVPLPASAVARAQSNSINNNAATAAALGASTPMRSLAGAGAGAMGTAGGAVLAPAARWARPADTGHGNEAGGLAGLRLAVNSGGNGGNAAAVNGAGMRGPTRLESDFGV